MPVLLEGTAVVILNEALDRCLEGGASEFHTIAPNAMSFGDGEVTQASFMSHRDAELFRDKLVLMGLRDDEDSPDLVLVDAHNQTMHPTCDWLRLIEYKGNLIASHVTNDSDVVVAPESWDPDAGPTLQHMSAEEVRDRLEFVRREERVDVYRDRQTGQLLYSARLHETPQELFKKSADIVLGNMRHPGQPPPPSDVQQAIRGAIGQLQQLVTQQEDAWRVWFLLGKAWHAVDRIPRAIGALERALEVADQPQSIIYKELAGVLLVDGATERACEMGEKAVALAPDDVELLGNLGIAYLLDGRVEIAGKTLEHALAIHPDDSTNQYVMEKIKAVQAGRLSRPKTLAELEGRRPTTRPVKTAARKPGWLRGWLRRISTFR
ncbi:Tetratricopeptide repeat protein [Stieleria maiorica]|uniref:Tetratricopeptide repeat protein n=1 Tax=Stieleria maiorica TaxID=2795974 RepID=A0A5B9M5W9_9BACT|nr:tetratricopeptide repeat protein [Stieleria maiorica]QEF96209.1 Tetratricopeptide repeat protein [Stieleria maiorica]